MASFVARRALSTTARRLADSGEQALRAESKRNPEIMVRHIRSEELGSLTAGSLCDSLERVREGF